MAVIRMEYLAYHTQVGNYEIAEMAFIAASEPFIYELGVESENSHSELYRLVDSYIWEVRAGVVSPASFIPGNRHSPMEKSILKFFITEALADKNVSIRFGRREVEFRMGEDTILVQRDKKGQILIVVTLASKEAEEKAAMIRETFPLEFDEQTDPSVL